MKESDLEVIVNRIEQRFSSLKNDLRCAREHLYLVEREEKEVVYELKRLYKKLKIKCWNPNL